MFENLHTLFVNHLIWILMTFQRIFDECTLIVMNSNYLNRHTPIEIRFDHLKTFKFICCNMEKIILDGPNIMHIEMDDTFDLERIQLKTPKLKSFNVLNYMTY